MSPVKYKLGSYIPEDDTLYLLPLQIHKHIPSVTRRNAVGLLKATNKDTGKVTNAFCSLEHLPP
jgi:hypothetical protein